MCQAGLPEPRDLSTWWHSIEAAIESLDQSFLTDLHDPLSFGRIHMATFGPVVLGPLGWQQINHAACSCWDSFRRQVEQVFGLQPEQLKEKFYAM